MSQEYEDDPTRGVGEDDPWREDDEDPTRDDDDAEDEDEGGVEDPMRTHAQP